jgi:hypothetical protein
MTLPARKPFELPTAITITFRSSGKGKVVAHALDFDLVCVGENREEADKKVRLSIRSYVEFGFLNQWSDDIRYDAPLTFWPPQGTKLEVGEPIEIMSKDFLVYNASQFANESRETASMAR